MKITIVRAALVVLWFALATPALAQTTVTLMQGQNGYSGTTDAKIACCTYADTNYGADTYYALIADTSTSLLIRFAIFQSEGGPVPNGATITSATLSFYKYWGPDAVYKASRLLKSWNESQVTWTITGAGSSWSTPGAFGATDVAATPDGQGSVGDAAGCSVSSNWPDYCWLNINVTSGVQAFASGTPNYGWKIAYVSGANASSPKEFNSRENPNWPTLRPKLTIT